MANPNIDQGNLNRLLASVNFTNLPTFNIGVSYLAPEAIDMNFEGAATATLPTLTGIVNSPEPYQIGRVTVHLNRAQAFSDMWKDRWMTNTILGPFVVRPDTPNMKPFNFINGAIASVDRMALGGKEVGFVLVLAGALAINAALWP